MAPRDPLLETFLEEADELLEAFESALLALESAPADREPLGAAFRAAHTLKGNSAMLGFERIAEVTHALEDLLVRLRDGATIPDRGAIDLLLRAGDVLRGLLGAARAGQHAASPEVDGLLAALAARAGRGGEDEPSVSSPAPGSSAAPLVAVEEDGRRPLDSAPDTIRVATDKVDRLVDLAGELVIAQSMVAQAVRQLSGDGLGAERLGALAEAVAQMDRHTRELEERVMAIRMLPIRTAFGRFTRVVRDVAQASGKQVRLETRGDETELDRTVIERITDPLLHLVRNAVDHGLEPPEERRARGKPPVGTVLLAASQRGGSIFIEVTDDGRGLDRARIRARAVEAGLIANGEPLSDEQVDALIWAPGFSTAAEVTEVSGRGVGTDVIRRGIEALGGTIAVETRPGDGTTFRVQLPLTLAIIEGQALRVGGETYVVPLAAVIESVRPAATALHVLVGRAETFVWRGEAVPVVRLHHLFDVPDAEEDPTRGLVVVVEHDGRRAALLVDELLGQQQFVVKNLDRWLCRSDCIAGATILGDGRIALILDVPALVTAGRQGGSDPAPASAATAIAAP
jgi:two-component system chemotaxis sensor kinase CheA